ncbi:hypothetical protein ACFPME_08275 [Rhodanobacter umsongensis]|uniref:DUF4261 domain-containing protein n=1 Tax=Rhodanobacter umsongensis TaxID=633153 RepID=A0ABW0JMB0_9GAMM
MSDTPPSASWPRPYWQPGEEDAVLQFYVFGKFDAELLIPSPRYGSPGLPAGVEIQRFQNAVLRQWEGYPLNGALGALLKEDASGTYEQARIAPEVLVVRGVLKDGASLDYLRDTMGVLAGMLDVGGTAILDPQILTLFTAEQWRRHYLVKDGAPPRNHVLILCSGEEAADRSWVHTRGMRKFGRPDISLHHVPERDVDRAGVLCERLVELLSLGANFGAGHKLEVDGVPEGLVARPGGSLDDPEFNNTHIAFRWPE